MTVEIRFCVDINIDIDVDGDVVRDDGRWEIIHRVNIGRNW